MTPTVNAPRERGISIAEAYNLPVQIKPKDQTTNLVGSKSGK